MPAIEPVDHHHFAQIEIFQNLAMETDRFERYTHPHAGRVAAIADEIGKSFHLGPRDRLSLRVAALAHDLGEAAMGRDYIHRDGTLSDDERTDLARHPVLGEYEAAEAGADRGAQLLVRWHHEWWNGGGYPDGLRFEQIPLGARILHVADVYAALTDERPFRPALSEKQARDHLLQWIGVEFDPGVVKALLSLEPFKELTSYYVESTPPDLAAIADDLMGRIDQLGN
jgi:HD-GYP domain-containing protein (c-di-GMP phosphodiesterase class II)